MRGFPELGQAEETAGPWRRRARGLEAEGVVGVGTSSTGVLLPEWDVSTVIGGWVVTGVVPSRGKARQRNC